MGGKRVNMGRGLKRGGNKRVEGITNYIFIEMVKNIHIIG